MESLKYLLFSFFACYLGSFSYILYQILFYQQKRFILIKIICYFSFIAFLIIKVKNKYSITPLMVYSFIYLIGMYISRKLFRVYLIEKSKEYKAIKNKFYPIIKYILLLLFIPPLVYIIVCRIKEYRYYKKYPQERKKTRYELF